MKRMLLCSFTVFSVIIHAQPPLNIDENFEDNRKGWFVGAKENYTCEIENGKYIIDYFPKEKTNLNFFWKSFLVDEMKDFIIEAKLRHVSGSDNNNIAIAWGCKDWKNSNFFSFSGNQYYKLGRYEEGNYVPDVKWTKDVSVVKPSGEYNVLKIHKKKEVITCYINDKKVAKIDYKPFSGNYFGFMITSPMKVEAEYFRIYQHGDANISLVDNPVNGYVKENLGKSVNTEFSETSPIISADGKTLYYVIKNSPDNIGGEKDDIYVSTLGEDGEWKKSVNIGPPINNTSHNSIVSVSPDENTLIVNGVYNKDGSSKGKGISISNRTRTGWEVPLEIEIEDYYNDNQYVNNCLSSNKKVLIMSVQRKDSYGEKDLYVSFEKNGKFSRPVNMGSVLNTKFDESTPFLAADDKTLYFSTSGHPGYGSNDIFVSQRLDDTWLNWSKPKNLGPEINTSNWDAYFTVPGNGEYAYLVSDENSIGKADIFRIKLGESVKPDPVILVRGKVLNAKTNQPLPAVIIYENPDNGTEVGSALSDPTTGEYKIVLPGGAQYGFMAEKEGFYAASDFLDLQNTGEYGEIVRDLYLKPIEKDETFRLNNVFFDTDKWELREESVAELQRLVHFLQKNPKIKIRIEGHTDGQGNAAHNLKLSENRAASVAYYLTSNGIDVARVSSKGFGLTQPVMSNDTSEGRRYNRRVEFRIVE